MMIKPTVGRMVWYRGAKVQERPDEERDTRAAIISFVHGDRMVNLCVIHPNGQTMPATSVPLRQPEDPIHDGTFCEWMPYQVGQAKKVTDEIAGLMEIVEKQAFHIDDLNERLLALEPHTTQEEIDRLRAECDTKQKG